MTTDNHTEIGWELYRSYLGVLEEGSLSGAARAMGMSYRRAWLLVEEANGLFAAPLVESSAGGTGGGGARVTALGLKAIAAYRDIEKEVIALVDAKLSAVAEFRTAAED